MQELFTNVSRGTGAKVISATSAKPRLVIKKALLTLKILLGCFSILGQSSSVKSEFGRLLVQSKEDLVTLLISRGASYSSCEKFTNNGDYSIHFNDFTSFLKDRKKAHPDQGFLFYFYENSQLKMFLFTSDSMVQSSILLDSGIIEGFEKDLFISIGIYDALGGSYVMDRGISLANTKMDSRRSDTLIDFISSTLFPSCFLPLLVGLRNLIIQPCLNIGLIPFALLRPWGKKGGFLVDSMSHSIGPSICVLRDEWSNGVNYRDGYQPPKVKYTFVKPLIVGDPVYAKNEFHFKPLPGARKEAIEVHKRIGGTCLIGANASVSAVEKVMKENADFLYFATHAYSDLKKPVDGSFLALSPDEDNPTGMLTGRMIQQKKLQADLAILSACQTGYGKTLRAGYIGLGRAFYKAGVKNVVSTLWSIDDQASLSLMLIFTEELQKPHFYFPSEPLRQAILKQKALTPEPKFWAPFMVFGFGF